MDQNRKTIIEAKNLYAIFGSNPKKAIPLIQQGFSRDAIKHKTGQIVGLCDCNLSIYEGEIFVIMGLSGSGKSTLLRCFNRLIEPTMGTLMVNGTDLMKQSKRQLRKSRMTVISMVFQNFALLPHRTLLENVEFGLEINGIPKSQRKAKALAALEMVKLKDWSNAYPHQVSGGMKQRVGLARSLVLEPKIILMDEAFSALDPLIRAEMQDELIELQRVKNNTIIFVSHDLDEALKIGHRILILKEGSIMQCGTPEEILSAPANDYIRKFVQNADFSKILTASSLMQRPKAIASSDQTPRIALYKMDRSSLSKMYIVDDKTKTLIGYVTIEDVDKAIKDKKPNLESIIRKDFVMVTGNTPVAELLEKSVATPIALAVVSDKSRLQGVITRSHLIAGLGKMEVTP